MFAIFLSILLAIVGAITFWRFSISTHDYWKKLGVFYSKPTPFFGSMVPMLLMRQALHEMYEQLYRLMDKLPYGGYFEMRTPILIIKDPALVQRILVTDFKCFNNRGYTLVTMDKKLNPLNEHLFLFSGQRWKMVRQKMCPVFTPGKLKGMQTQILDCLSGLINYMETDMTDAGKDIDVRGSFLRFTIDVTGSCAFGIECHAMQLKNEFQKLASEILKPRMSQLVKYFVGVIDKKLLSVLRLTDFPSDLVKFFQNTVYDTVLYRRENNLKRADLLQQLMDMQNEAVDPRFSVDGAKKSLSKDDSFDEVNIAANAFLFFIGGFETSSSTLSFCLYELALNQEIQEELRIEVLQAYHRNGDKIDVECLHEMTYMDAVIAETLRKYPVFPVLYRQCLEDYVIPETGLKLKQGDRVHIPVWSLHHDWRYYPNPEFFNPERFRNRSKEFPLPGTYLPFGDGPRYCIGKRFAEMMMKLALSKMLILYHFTPCSKTEVPITYEKSFFSVTAHDGVWLNMTKRERLSV